MTTKAVLISGTSTGIGEACVRRLAGEGWIVYAGVRRDEDGQRLVDTIDGDVRPLRLDVTDDKMVHEAVTRVRDQVGAAGLHGLVNNAGVGLGGPIELISDEDWRQQFDVNLFGLLTLTREAFPLVRKAGGRFVFIGSIAGRLSAPLLAPYSASKHAVAAVAEAMRHELARTEMRVSLVEPGEVKTAIWGKADQQAAEIEATFDDDARARYQHLVDVVRGFTDEGKRKGVEADKVADVVHHALTSSRPKPRYLVGPDAKVTATIVRLLPDRLKDRAARLQFKQYEKAGRSLR